ncbi:tail assembly protein [Luteibacter yeojuensis]|uniref:Tail assembly protein n=1 Tax=Luteibacter yeojuensis TaxID=345309 RepID=A0A7X5TNW9_9GAMM|nr:tail assembly protein [Luteibacter yeojuensis]
MTATTILLDGPARKRFGREFSLHLDTKSPREAVRAMCTVVPGFRAYLEGAHQRGIEFAVFRGRGARAENIGLGQFDDPAGSVIRIVPVIKGSKRAGVLQTIIGIILIVVSFWTGGSTLATGISLVAGGVVQMLSPQPKLGKAADSSDNQSSYVFNGPINTSAQGGCVPTAYGRVRVGSAIISAGMEAQDYSAAQSNIGHGTVGGNFKQTPFDDDF